MIPKVGFFTSGSEDIYFEKIEIPGVPCKTLVLHGAGSSDSTRTTSLRHALFEVGVPTLAIDFSGHGKSSRNTVGSIAKRLEEATAAITLLDTQESISLIGFSMSGEVSIRLFYQFNVKNLFLFAPGIYNKDVISMPFGDEFTKVLRTHENWRNNQISDLLSNFLGNIILFTPENDDVIPEGVNEIIMQSAPKAYTERIVIPDAPHMIGKWMNENPEQIPQILQKIQQFIF